ncbi:hypothetical protein VPHD479_0227 [Vibrio phage D479]
MIPNIPQELIDKINSDLFDEANVSQVWLVFGYAAHEVENTACVATNAFDQHMVLGVHSMAGELPGHTATIVVDGDGVNYHFPHGATTPIPTNK